MKHHLNLTEKQALVTRYTGGETVSAICMETGISKSTLYSWIKQYQPARTRSGRVITPKDYDSLLRRCEKQEKLIAVLKTAGCLQSAPLKEKLMALERLYGQFSVHVLCEALDVPRGTFYNTSSGTNGVTAPMPNIGKNCERQFKTSLMKVGKHLEARRFVQYFMSAVIKLVQRWCGNL